MNENIYTPPNCNVSGKTVTDIPFPRKIIGTLFIILTLAIYFLLDITISQFEEMFTAFNAELPLITRVTTWFAGKYSWLGLPCLVFATFWIHNVRQLKYAQLFLQLAKYYFLFSLVVFILVKVSLYIPVLQMGSIE